jgi:hypothetical protein
MHITLNGNLFSKRVLSSDPTMVAWGAGDNVTLTRYEAPATLAAAKNSAWKNAQAATCSPVASMTADIAGAQSVALGLPSDVAAVVGQAAGYKKVGLIG